MLNTYQTCFCHVTNFKLFAAYSDTFNSLCIQKYFSALPVRRVHKRRKTFTCVPLISASIGNKYLEIWDIRLTTGKLMSKQSE